jgi:type I restriction enzyme M protein
VKKSKREGGFEPDPDLREFENVPLMYDVTDYFQREVLPYHPDAWIDQSKEKTGYEINFNRYFYRDIRTRSLEEIDAALKDKEQRILLLLREAINDHS